MASFPAVFPMPNAAGAAGEAAGAASSVYNSLQNRIAAAADQQAKQQRQQQLDQQTADQRAFENALQMHAQGAIPAEIIGQGPNGMKTRTPNPAAQGAGQTVQEPQSGRRVYLPTPSEKEQAALNDTNSFVAAPGSDTEKFLQETANIKPGTRIPLTHAGAVTGLAREMREASDASEKRKQVATVTQDASDKARKLGFDLPVGSSVPIGMFKEVTDALKPEKEKEPKAPKSLHFENDTETGLVRGYDPETGELVSTSPGMKKKEKDPNAQKPASKATLVAIQNKKSQDLQKAQAGLTKELSTAVTDEDRKTANDNFRSAQQQAQLNYESDLSIATGNEIPHNDWADRPAPARPKSGSGSAPSKTTSTAPAKPAAPAPTKTAAAPAKSAAMAEGTVIVNPKTKERRVLKGGAWQALP